MHTIFDSTIFCQKELALFFFHTSFFFSFFFVKSKLSNLSLMMEYQLASNKAIYSLIFGRDMTLLLICSRASKPFSVITTLEKRRKFVAFKLLADINVLLVFLKMFCVASKKLGKVQ